MNGLPGFALWMAQLRFLGLLNRVGWALLFVPTPVQPCAYLRQVSVFRKGGNLACDFLCLIPRGQLKSGF